MTVKISACLIVRDAPGLEECLQSLRPHVDEIVIVDTGSTDNTPEVARRYADKFETFLDCNNVESGLIEDFSKARNRSFLLATHDVVFWIDSDDVLRGGEHLRAHAAELVKHKSAQVLFPYEYQRDSDGNVITYQYRERLLYPRQHWEWRFPVHEACLLGAGHEDLHTETADDVLLVHKSEGKPREVERNLRILRAHIAKVGDSDQRSLYYFGVELNLAANRAMGLGRFDLFLESTGQSIRALKRFVEIAFSDDERALAMQTIALNYQRLNDHGEAIVWASKAFHVKPWPEPYWLVMESYYSLAKQEPHAQRAYLARGAHFGHIGTELCGPVEQSQSLQGQNPTLRYRAQEVLSFCLAGTGALNEAIAACEYGLKGLPKNELLQNNLKAFKRERAKRGLNETLDALDIAKDARAIIHGAINGDFQIQLLEKPVDMPGASAGSVQPAVWPEPKPAPARAERALGAKGLSIIIYVGPGLEPWDGDKIAREGMGGSETMAWAMTVRLAKLGHSVTLIGHLADSWQYQEIENVSLLDYRASLPKSCDVLISSRRPEVFDAPIARVASILWVHDVHCGEAIDHKRNMKIDRVFALSNWHKSLLMRCYPVMSPDKIIVTRNGIDPALFNSPAQTFSRNPHRAIYSSSPDRGLDTLLDCWPIVRRSVPNAELHVYYGFDNWEKGAASFGGNADNQTRRIEHLKAKLERTAGVVMHGRVGKVELAQAFLSSGVWTYPTEFTETSCISAMEAQAAGCRIITTPIAALNETVSNRGQLIHGGPSDPSFVERFSAAVVSAMLDGQRVPDDRALLAKYARENFALDSLAEDWDKILRELHTEMSERVLPAYYPAPKVSTQ